MVKLEAGKFYRTRDGRKVGPMVQYDHEINTSVWRLPDYQDVDGVVTWWEGGEASYNKDQNNLDIIEEWSAPDDYEWDDRSEPVRLNPNPAAPSGAQREKLTTLPYDLVPYQEITDAYVRVAEKGAVKYAPWNWSKGLPRIQILCSLLRHTFAYIRGEDHDKETGLSHTDHILWNAVALSHNVHHALEDGRRGEPERDYKSFAEQRTDKA